MKALSTFLLGAVVLGLAGFAPAQDKKDEKKDDDNAKKIVGKWEITKAGGEAPVGSLIEFTKDGKLSASIKIEKMDIKIDGTYKVEKDKLMMKLKIGESTADETVTIKKLTDDELELEDKDKKLDVLKKKK